LNNKISTKSKIGFGVGEFSSSIFFTLTSFWLMNFLTDEVQISAGIAGTALLVGKIWDAVIDPFIGYISDRTRSRWGRRRPYLLFFAIPFGVAFVLMFRNPGIDNQTGKFVWAMLTYIFFCTAYSLTNIPYNALLPEMTTDYDERANISGYKNLFAVIGTLLGAGAAMPLMALFTGKTAGFIGMSAVFGFLAALSLLVTFFSVREPKEIDTSKKTKNILQSIKEVFINKPFMLLLFTWFSNTTAATIMQTMLIYYYKYLIQDENAVTPAMIALLLATMAAIPLWVWLSKKIGKKLAYISGMTLTLVAVLLFAFVADKVSTVPSLIIMALAGVGFSSHYVAPWAMVPDSIEFGYSNSGKRNEGVYYSIWTFMTALAGALAGFLVGQGLDLFGYVANVAQTAKSLLGMRLMISALPGIFILCANLLLIVYPLNKKSYEEVLEKIKLMEADRK
jgi:GPH family glycoside/pentoside/hexuronide:cation symporter